MKVLSSLLLFTALITSSVQAHTDADHGDHAVVPEHEYEIARQMQAQGPQQSRQVGPVTLLGSISLEGEVPDNDKRILRAREIQIAPGGVVAVHQHDQRPGLAYILEGELVEHRNDKADPQLRGVGAVSFERTGVTHWWENQSDRTARALVVDIVPAE